MMNTSIWLPAALAIVLGVSAAAQAQQPAQSFDQLQVVARLGETITVTDTSGRDTRGMLADLTPASLVLIVDGMRRDFKEGDVDRVRQRRGDSLRNGALWGLGTGAVLGLVLAAFGAAADGGYADKATAIVPVVITGGLGSAVGVGVDAIIEGQQVIYTRTARVTWRFRD